jgi:hypothetical protein
MLSACNKASSTQATTVSATAMPGTAVTMHQITVLPSKTGYWLRPTIEMLADNKKELLITYLDEAMGITELGVQKFRSNDIEGLYNICSPILKDQVDINQFRQSINGLVNASGEIKSLEYRNQAFVYEADTLEGEINLTYATSHTYYAVTTTKYKGEGLFLDIGVYQKDGQFGITAIKYNSYGNEVPSWLQYPNAIVAPPY